MFSSMVLCIRDVRKRRRRIWKDEIALTASAQ
jgi:hypothetical protein